MDNEHNFRNIKTARAATMLFVLLFLVGLLFRSPYFICGNTIGFLALMAFLMFDDMPSHNRQNEGNPQ